LELTARVEGGHDDLERGLAGISGVRVDRDTAAVVADGQPVAGLERDLDPGGEAGDRLVHTIVDDFGGKMVERAVVRPADVHAGAATDRLEAFEDLDRGGVVAVGRGRSGSRKQVGHYRNAIRPGFEQCQARGQGFSTGLGWSRLFRTAVKCATLRIRARSGERHGEAYCVRSKCVGV